MFDRTIGSDPASCRAAKPRYLPHAGRPSPRIRREPGPRVHLLQRTVPWGARRHRYLRRRLRPRSRRGSLRRPSLHHPAGRERLDPRGTRQGVHGQGTKGKAVQGPDAHAQGSGRHPRPGRRARPGPRTAHKVRRSPPPTRPARARHGHLPGLRPRTPTLARAGRRHPARTSRRRAQERCRAPERVRACESRESGYSADHLGRLVRDGKIPNAGRPGAPRIARSHLPRKTQAPATPLLVEKHRRGEVSNAQIVQSIIEGGIE